MTFIKTLKLIISDFKRDTQIFLKFGKYHYKEFTFKRYTESIETNFEDDHLDFKLFNEFSLFCQKEHLNSKAISFLLRMKNKYNAIEVCNYFLIQQYGRGINGEKNYETKAVILSLLKESMQYSFGTHFFYDLEGMISVFPNEVKSQYVLLEIGLENYGYIQHEIESVHKKYLTKIGISTLKTNENTFYQDIREIYPSLKNITPSILGVLKSKSGLISCLIMEDVQGGPTDYTMLDMIIKCHKEFIQECVFTPTVYNKLKRPFELGYAPTYLSGVFSRIHKELYYKQVIEWGFHTLKEHNYRPEIKFVVRRFFEKMDEVNIYDYVLPKKHYTLCHGDFQLNNIIYSQSTNQLSIIDWSHCTFGPKLLDFALFFRTANCSYQTIHEFFTEDIDSCGEYDDMDMILFFFGSITISLMMHQEICMNEDPDKFFRPAVNRCMELIDKIQMNKAYKINHTLS